MLTLSFRRVSSTHHEIAYRRSDGSGESATVETKSILVHDFIHYCVESEARLTGGFYGLIDSGRTYAELAGKMPAEFEKGEALEIEQVVGPLSGVIKGNVTPGQFMESFQVMMRSLDRPMPSWLSVELISRICARYRQVMGVWNATPFGQNLELVFEA